MALSQQMLKVAVHFMDGLGTPVAMKVKSLIVQGRWSDLVTLRVAPSDYSCSEAYLKDQSAVEFLRKFEGLPTGIDLHKVAVDGFGQCEKLCASSNHRISRYLDWFENGFHGDAIDLKLYEFLSEIRGEVRSILGCLPKVLVPKFGPGSTYFDRGDRITIPHKMSSRLHRTESSWWTDGFLHQTAWGRAILKHQSLYSAPTIVRGNRFTSVPKDSSKNRGICIEASQNLAFQLAIGTFLKERLKEAGNDLKFNQDKHRELARRASIDGFLATIDLSNASDTVSKLLVQLLLPQGWFDVLNDLRSPFTLVDGRWYHLQKFSSMGNGFTFELETLLFLALGRALVRGEGGSITDVSVYGDDIILPVRHAKSYVALLSLMGFSTNSRKTFVDGPFRESCGGDFFNGQAVRPYYLKEEPHEPQQWIKLANGIRRLGTSDSLSDAWRLNLISAWHNALAPLPVDIRRLRGPRALGDVVIHDHFTKWNSRHHNSGHRWIRVYQPVARRISLTRFQPEVQLASFLYGVPSSGAGIRDGISGYRKKWRPLIEVTEV